MIQKNKWIDKQVIPIGYVDKFFQLGWVIVMTKVIQIKEHLKVL